MVTKHRQWRIQDFPWGGVDLVEGGVDSRGGHISKILYVKTKESGPLGCRITDQTLKLPNKRLHTLITNFFYNPNFTTYNMGIQEV